MIDKNKLIDIIKSYPNCWINVLKSKKYKEILTELENKLFNFNDLPISTKVYWYLNDINEYPKCSVCGKELKHNIKCHPINGYKSLHCSMSCAIKDKNIQSKTKETKIKKYGENYNKIIGEKVSNIRNSFSESKKLEINKKRELTCMEKYGVSNISKLSKIKNTKTETFKNLDWNKINNHRTNTLIEKYGEDYLKIIGEKISISKKQFSEEKKNEILLKRKQTCLEKYGNEYPIHSEKSNINRIKSLETNFYRNKLCNNDFVEPIFSLEYYLNNRNNNLKWKCKKCGEVFECKLFEYQPFYGRCLKCYPMNQNVSSYEKEISEFIKTLGIKNIITNNRHIISPMELDIYIPDKKIAFEFDGIFWHSENIGTNKNYHLTKTNKCEEKGIHLIHIFENEWILKNNIVKSRIKNLLGVFEKTIYARLCEIKEVDSKTSKKFQDDNHIQGSVNCSINLGLYYKNELISLMTFSKTRFSKKYEYELVRFCNKLEYHIPGAAGKLLKYFERNYNPKSLVSYADRRWSIGNLYEKLNFKLNNIAKPNYFYFKVGTLQLEPRIKYQKHKLKNILEKFDENLSEYENMKLNNYYRIYDCGNLVYVKEY